MIRPMRVDLVRFYDRCYCNNKGRYKSCEVPNDTGHDWPCKVDNKPANKQAHNNSYKG